MGLPATQNDGLGKRPLHLSKGHVISTENRDRLINLSGNRPLIIKQLKLSNALVEMT